jgi:predicted nucleotidyltransferase
MAIRRAIAARCGSAARVLLFGSRVDDTKRGGDIDLLVELDVAPADSNSCLSGIQVELFRSLGERKIDVLLTYPGANEARIHQLARETGVPV